MQHSTNPKFFVQIEGFIEVPIEVLLNDPNPVSTPSTEEVIISPTT